MKHIDIEKITDQFMRYVTLVLIIMMILVILVSVLELGLLLIRELDADPPWLFFDISETLNVFGYLLLIVVGLELLETLKAYLDDDAKRLIEVVLLAAIVAVTRKIIIIDYKTMSWELVGALGFLLLALTLSYFLIKRSFDSPRIEDDS